MQYFFTAIILLKWFAYVLGGVEDPDCLQSGSGSGYGSSILPQSRFAPLTKKDFSGMLCSPTGEAGKNAETGFMRWSCLPL
jgi:hypothetical protein